MRFYCDDCNDNVLTIIELIKKIEKVSEVWEWKITQFDAIPIDKGDFSGTGVTLDSPRQRLYEFSQKLLHNHVMVLTHLEFISLLENIRCIYDAKISFCVSGFNNTITIFDGDIIEVSGFIETSIY